MRDMGTPHQRMQELCDCFAETDPLKEMALLGTDEDKEEAALKWLALAILHGVDRHAKEICLERTRGRPREGGGRVQGRGAAFAGGRDRREGDRGGQTDQPHRGRKGRDALAVGIRDTSIEIRMEVERENGDEKITLKFGKLR